MYSVTACNPKDTRNSQWYALITGAVYVDGGGSVSFRGEIVFANNTAGSKGGTAVKCTLTVRVSHSEHLVFCNQTLAIQSETCLSVKCVLFCFF